MAGTVRVLSALALALLSGWTAARAEGVTTKITYVTATSVYIGAGREEGLLAGDRFEVLRADKIVAVLTVTELTGHKAVCSIEDRGSGGLVAGDLVRQTPRAVPAPGPAPAAVPPPAAPGAPASGAPAAPTAPAATAAPAAATAGAAAAPVPPSSGLPAAAAAPEAKVPRQRRPSLLHEAGISGRVGLRATWARDRDPGGVGYSQPSLDLSMAGRRIGGSSIDMSVDVRSYRTYRTGSSPAATDAGNVSRIYALWGAWQQPNTPWRLTLGRQLSPSLAAVSLFDGVLGEFVTKRFSAGVFAGTQPDLATYAFSSDVREYGFYSEFRSAPASTASWAVSGGVVGSYDQGIINREFVFLQGRLNTKSLSAYIAEEIDINRGWKREAGESSFSATSTFASVRWHSTGPVGFYAGLDNRRNPRLVQDIATPVTEFDDSFRQGYWAGVDARLGKHVRLDLSGRRSDGGVTTGTSDLATFAFSLHQLTRFDMAVRSRTTSYTNNVSDGILQSLSFGISPWRPVHFEVIGGMRRETATTPVNGVSTSVQRNLDWFGLNTDVVIGRHWLWILSLERTTGEPGFGENNDQAFTALSLRF